MSLPYDAVLPPGTELLAPGVRGYVVETEDAIYVPVIEAVEPGNGDVGRYLDSLPADKAIRVPDVLSPLLMEMLLRRGYVTAWEYAPEFEEDVQILERPATRRKI